jgi:hypothetical protein
MLDGRPVSRNARPGAAARRLIRGVAQIARLRKEKAQLEQELAKAHFVVDLPSKLQALLAEQIKRSPRSLPRSSCSRGGPDACPTSPSPAPPAGSTIHAGDGYRASTGVVGYGPREQTARCGSTQYRHRHSRPALSARGHDLGRS